MMRALLLFGLAFVPMLFEARRSRRHERALRARGAAEPRRDVYAAMLIAYPSCFLAMIAEHLSRPRTPGCGLAAGGALFGGGKLLKYWAIATLGERWTFRVLVPPGAVRITTGPYRWTTHPNYVGVTGEIAGFALLAQAPVTGLLAIVSFAALMRARVRVEERAMGARGQ